MMAVETFVFCPAYARRIPDPNFAKRYGAERHLFLMPVAKMPSGIGLDPNARNPNIRKRVYQQVEASLLEQDASEPGTFHLKNKGITIIAKSVMKQGEKYKVTMLSRMHGIVDGGHTYELIQQNIKNGTLPDDQYVMVDVRVGVPDAWIRDIAGGLNTSVQVEDMSLDHLAGLFEWLKSDLKSEPYYCRLAWSENDKGEFDARDIISLMLLFNVALFPNNTDEHPVMGYEKKSLALKLFEKEQAASFRRMRTILKDILRFHDVVRREARIIWNKAGGKAGNLAFVEHRKVGMFDFIFTGEQDDYRLTSGALYPMLAAFRWYVEDDPISGKMQWRGGFSAVLDAWRGVGLELMRSTVNTSEELGRNPQSIGKSRNHWANLHARVVKYDLMRQQGESA